jgi:hypothetical protein
MNTPSMTTDEEEIVCADHDVVRTPKLDEFKFSSHTMSLMGSNKRKILKNVDTNSFDSPLSGSEADDSVLSVKFTPVISSSTMSLLSRIQTNKIEKKLKSSAMKSTGRDSIESSASSVDTPCLDTTKMLPTRTPMLPPMDENGRIVKTCKKDGKIVRESIGSVSSVDTPVLDTEDLPTRTPMLPPMKPAEKDDVVKTKEEVTKKMKGMEVYDEEEDDDEAMMDSEEDEETEEESEEVVDEEKKKKKIKPVRCVEEEEYTKMPKYLRWQVTKSSLDAVIEVMNMKFEVDTMVTKEAVHDIVHTLNIEKLKSTSVILMLCKLNRFVIVSKGKYRFVC